MAVHQFLFFVVAFTQHLENCEVFANYTDREETKSTRCSLLLNDSDAAMDLSEDIWRDGKEVRMFKISWSVWKIVGYNFSVDWLTVAALFLTPFLVSCLNRVFRFTPFWKDMTMPELILLESKGIMISIVSKPFTCKANLHVLFCIWKELWEGRLCLSDQWTNGSISIDMRF